MHWEIADGCKLVRFDPHAFPVSLELENDLFTAKDQEIRIFSDDPVDVSFSFQEAKLGIGFVWRYHIIDILSPQCLYLVSPFDHLYEEIRTHLDQLERHFGSDVYTFGISVPSIVLPALALQVSRSGKSISS